MSDEPLLLYPSRSSVLLHVEEVSPWWRRGAFLCGLIVVIVGAVDVSLRIDRVMLRIDTFYTAFAPLGTLNFGDEKKDTETIFATTTSPVSPYIATTTPLTPARIKIPSIKVDAEVEHVALKSDKVTMSGPKEFANAAWYKPGARPGEEGSAVIAGHLNSPRLAKDGVFKNLSKVQIGDEVILSDKGGRELVYVVTDMAEYKTNLAPREEIFSKTGQTQIALITCEGEWDGTTRTFDKRLVVIARLIANGTDAVFVSKAPSGL